MRLAKRELIRYGKITDTVSYNFKDYYWKAKYKDDSGNIYIDLIFNKKEYPTENDIPKIRMLEFNLRDPKGNEIRNSDKKTKQK